jgi:anti-sigma factor RsiW
MKKSFDESLPCFDADGHLTLLALTALADGQELFPEAAEQHLGTCEECSHRLVTEALSSALTGALLRASAPKPIAATEPLAEVPWRAILAALVVALLGLSPALRRLPAFVFHAAPALAHAGPVLSHGLFTAMSAAGRSGLLVTLTSSAFLILVGVAVSRWSRSQGVTS